MERKIYVRRDLESLPVEDFPGWLTQSLADLGEEHFAQLMLEASEGDPFETSTPESALADLREMRDAAGERYDAKCWLLVSDVDGLIGVVLPQPYVRNRDAGTLHYLGVMPARRGQGLGRRLHQFGMQQLVRRGVRRYRGSTDVENAPMLAIFAANGCVVEDE